MTFESFIGLFYCKIFTVKQNYIEGLYSSLSAGARVEGRFLLPLLCGRPVSNPVETPDDPGQASKLPSVVSCLYKLRCIES